MLVQSWAVLAEVGSLEQRSSAMNEVKNRCLTEFGPMLYGPPFLTEREGIGRESAKRPGCGENGSCYTHGAMMYAAALIKHGKIDESLEIMKKVLFPMMPDNYQIRCGSPLWWSNYMQAPFAAHPGRSSNIISSGAPAWFYLNILEGLCGIKPTMQGLVISPALPSDWNEVFVERVWRESTYRISIKRTGKYSLTVDGKKLSTNTIPIPNTKSSHEVIVTF
jgi:cellobiose phosphorylase